MSKLSYKTLFIIFFFLLILTVIVFRFVLPKQKVSAAWWNDSWNYRKAINISSHNINESNVYIITSVNIGTTTKSQTDNGDFRFVTQSGDILPYYIASGTGTTNITFHVQFASFPVGAQTIYAYYGNSSIVNGFSTANFSTQASNYTIGSLSTEEAGGGPVAYWKFDEGVGTTAYNSVGTNNGILSGTTLPQWQNEDQCISGKCLLNTSGYISVNNLWTNFQNSSFSISSWVYFNDNSASDRSIVSIGLAGTDTQLHLVRRNNKIYFAFWGDDYSGDKTIEPNIWYHISVTWNLNTKQQNIYVNGTLDKSRTSSGSLNVANSSPLLIGRYATNSTIGYIDDFKIYSYARTADQIKLDYNSRGSFKGSSVNLGIKSSTAPDLKSKLVAHYKFDENNGSTVYDSSGNNKNGILAAGSSSPTWNINGYSNKALIFDGNDSITLVNEIVSTSSIRVNGVTYSAWIKPSTVTGTQKIVGQKSSSGYSDLASGGIDISSGKARMIAYDDNIDYKYATGNTTLNSNQWYLITGVYNPSDQKIKIYVNGKFDGGETSITTFNRLISNDYNLIGSHNFISSFFNGLIDEVKIYNTALTDEEIKQDYNQGSAIQFGSTNQTIGNTTTSLEYCIPGDTSFCASPVAEWNLNEGIGTTIKDISGNNINGNWNGVGSHWIQGKIGQGGNFVGAGNYITAGTSPSLNFGTGDFSIEFWIKYRGSTVINATYGALVAKDNISASNNPGFTSAISTYGSSGSNYGILFSTTNGAWGTGNVEHTNAYNLNTWYHVVAVRAGTTFTVYQNGKYGAIRNTAGINVDINNDFNLRIGGGSWGNPDTILDQVKIYNYARTPAQIAYSYNKGGPIGWWKFDECQGNIAYDWSGIGNTGSINIGPSGTQNSLGTCQIGTSAAWTNGSSGKTNSSLNFDGTDDYITVNNNSSLNLTQTGGAISLWFKTSTNANGSINGSLVAKSNGYANGYWFTKYNNKLRISLYGTSNIEMIGNKIITDNLWHHTIATWTPDTLFIYVDGTLDKSQGYAFTLTTATNPLYIARMINSGEGYFQGQVDDVRIYNYALTYEQVKQIYNGGSVTFR